MFKGPMLTESGVTGQMCIGFGVHKASCPQHKVCTELGLAGQDPASCRFHVSKCFFFFFPNLVEYD